MQEMQKHIFKYLEKKNLQQSLVSKIVQVPS